MTRCDRSVRAHDSYHVHVTIFRVAAFGFALLFAGVGYGQTASPPPESGAATVVQRMSLADCIRTAYEKHPDVQAIRAQVEGAEADRKSLRGSFFPQLSAEANVLVWDKELTADFGGGGAFPEIRQPTTDELASMSAFDGWVLETLAGLEPLMDAFGSATSMVIRDQVTWGVTLTMTQPLTPLYQIYKGYQAKAAMADKARTHGDTVREDVALQVATAYYATLQTQEYVVIAQSAVDQLQAHLEVARAFKEQGFIGRNEVLRVEVELANMRQRLIEAENGRILARANLATQMGLESGAQVGPEAVAIGDSLPAVSLSLTEARSEAIRARSELVEMALGIQAAEHGSALAWWELVPKLALVARYEHVGGQGTFALEDSFFAGLMLTWDFWDWGKSYFAAEVADYQVEALRLQQRRIEQLLELQVTQKYQNLRSSEQAFRVAHVAIEQAEEALRIERERFGVSAATSTDVLDAEANLTRARANQVNAYYAYMLARAELNRAMGKPLLAE